MINPVQKTGRMGPGMAYQNNAPTNKQVKRPLQWTEATVTLYINILPFTRSYICSLKPHSKKTPKYWIRRQVKSCGTSHKQEIWKIKDYNLTSQSVKSSTVRWYLQKALVNWGTKQEPPITDFTLTFVFNSRSRPVPLLIKTALLLVA